MSMISMQSNPGAQSEGTNARGRTIPISGLKSTPQENTQLFEGRIKRWSKILKKLSMASCEEASGRMTEWSDHFLLAYFLGIVLIQVRNLNADSSTTYLPT